MQKKLWQWHDLGKDGEQHEGEGQPAIDRRSFTRKSQERSTDIEVQRKNREKIGNLNFCLCIICYEYHLYSYENRKPEYIHIYE
jgi:hypothetical protein